MNKNVIAMHILDCLVFLSCTYILLLSDKERMEYKKLYEQSLSNGLSTWDRAYKVGYDKAVEDFRKNLVSFTFNYLQEDSKEDDEDATRYS